MDPVISRFLFSSIFNPTEWGRRRKWVRCALLLQLPQPAPRMTQALGEANASSLPRAVKGQRSYFSALQVTLCQDSSVPPLPRKAAGDGK